MGVTPPPPVDNTNLSSGNFTSTVILNNIINLVINMTGSLQTAAAAQANRLNFDTEWQKAYTDAMDQVHTFTFGGADWIAGSKGGFTNVKGNSFGNTNASWAAATRDSLNQFNSNLTQVMQNRQSVVSDDAKTLQSNVQQTNDAVNQQSNLGTSILQGLNTLLTNIFH